MSVVTTIILTCGLGELVDDANSNPAIDAVNAWLAARQKGVFADLGNAFGGHKSPQMCVYGGAFNYLVLDEFLTTVRRAPWDEPDRVQVFINGEEDERFTECNAFAASFGAPPDGETR